MDKGEYSPALPGSGGRGHRLLMRSRLRIFSSLCVGRLKASPQTKATINFLDWLKIGIRRYSGHADLRDHDQHPQYVQAYDASQIHPANALQFGGQVSLETCSRLEFLKSFLPLGFGLRRRWI